LETLSFLPAGPVPPNPSELLASRRFVDLVTSLRSIGACIVMDSGPLIPVSDGLVVASVADAVVLVANARSGSRRRLRRAVSQIRKAHAPLVGVVLNQAGKPVDFEGWKAVSTNGKDSYLQPARA
jgi:Mrp family chromosome partitioning ATPase